MDLGLTGKVAIITGGSEGIGKVAAHRMAAEGARAVIVARRPEVLEAAARDIEKSTGGGCTAHPRRRSRAGDRESCAGDGA